jgi:hypothetical protein
VGTAVIVPVVAPSVRLRAAAWVKAGAVRAMVAVFAVKPE